MTSIQVPGLLSFTIAIVVFFVGAGVNRAIKPLQSWNIPEAVTGGLLAAVATLIAYVVFRVEINFSLEARDMLLLYFFTGIGLNARLDDLISGGRPFLILLALTLVYLVHPESDRRGQRRGARPSRGHDAAARLRRADRRARHDDRLGADHRRAVRARQRARSRHRHGDARARGREPRRRSDRRLLIRRYALAGPKTPDPVVGLPDDPGRQIRRRPQPHHPAAHAA